MWFLDYSQWKNSKVRHFGTILNYLSYDSFWNCIFKHGFFSFFSFLRKKIVEGRGQQTTNSRRMIELLPPTEKDLKKELCIIELQGSFDISHDQSSSSIRIGEIDLDKVIFACFLHHSPFYMLEIIYYMAKDKH